MQLKFTLKCPQCGSTRFTAATAQSGPDDPMTCAQCGTSVNLAEEKKRIEAETRKAIEEQLKNPQG